VPKKRPRRRPRSPAPPEADPEPAIEITSPEELGRHLHARGLQHRTPETMTQAERDLEGRLLLYRGILTQLGEKGRRQLFRQMQLFGLTAWSFEVRPGPERGRLRTTEPLMPITGTDISPEELWRLRIFAIAAPVRVTGRGRAPNGMLLVIAFKAAQARARTIDGLTGGIATQNAVKRVVERFGRGFHENSALTLISRARRRLSAQDRARIEAMPDALAWAIGFPDEDNPFRDRGEGSAV
jgi:hypothetical protein